MRAALRTRHARASSPAGPWRRRWAWAAWLALTVGCLVTAMLLDPGGRGSVVMATALLAMLLLAGGVFLAGEALGLSPLLTWLAGIVVLTGLVVVSPGVVRDVGVVALCLWLFAAMSLTGLSWLGGGGFGGDAGWGGDGGGGDGGGG